MHPGQLSLLIVLSFSHFQYFLITYRSSRPKVFCKKAVLKNFVKFTGKHLFRSHFFFDKVADIQACNFIKMRQSNIRLFLWILRNFEKHFEEHLQAATSKYDTITKKEVKNTKMKEKKML